MVINQTLSELMIINQTYLNLKENKVKTYSPIENQLKYLQSFKKYLRQTQVFMWNSLRKENFNFYFSGDFYSRWQNYHYGRKTEH